MGLASHSEGAHKSAFVWESAYLASNSGLQLCVVRPVPVSVMAVGVCGTRDCLCVFAVLWAPKLGSESSWFSKKKEIHEALEVHENMLDTGLVWGLRRVW